MISVQENIPLKDLTTFKIGGAAAFYTEVHDEAELKEALMWARSRTMPHVILAGGSNVLIGDEGLSCLVIKISGTRSRFEGQKLIADAGCTLLDLIRSASVINLGGWEKLSGIPGTLGGAVRGNAGAFGTEIKDLIVSVRALSSNTLSIREFAVPECAFAYRMSYYKKSPEWIILEATLQLQNVEGRASLELGEETIRERERRHLQNVRAAGSFFMNPVAPDSVQKLFEDEKHTTAREGRVPAGWLIEKAGMKGAKVGDAQASLQHPNYLVNTGNASSGDVLVLALKIKKEVKDHFGIDLKEEAEILR